MMDVTGSSAERSPAVISMYQDQDQDRTTRADSEGPAHTDLERYTSYEGNDGTVIYDRENATAWIQSTVARSVPC
jgi:hypothetical protein